MNEQDGNSIAILVMEIEVNCVIHLHQPQNWLILIDMLKGQLIKLTKQQPSNSLGKDPHSWVSLVPYNSEPIQLSERNTKS